MKTVSNCDVSVPFAIPSSNIKIGISGRELGKGKWKMLWWGTVDQFEARVHCNCWFLTILGEDGGFRESRYVNSVPLRLEDLIHIIGLTAAIEEGCEI